MDDTRTSPYKGLEPFDERDADYFFGRDRETRLITASLFAAPLTLLYGASGVGKSSVLRAGVLPRLRKRPDVLPIVFPTVVVADPGATPSVIRGWQTDPVGGIKETAVVALFASAAGDEPRARRYREMVRANEMAPLRDFLAACADVCERRLMIILDQFEEYPLYHPQDEAFAEQFPAAVAAGDAAASFLVSLREDALGKLDRFKGRIPSLWDSYRRVDHLDAAAAHDAICLPLDEYNRRNPATPDVFIEPALVDAVLRDVQTELVPFADTGAGTPDPSAMQGRIETPYLQLVMMRLWEREMGEGSTTLRLTTLQAEGGAAEIVRTHLDRVMQQFTAEEQDLAARVFHRLVTPSGAKIAFSVTDLADYEMVEPQRLAPILQRLEEGSRRILRRVATRGGAAEEPRYEIFHDRLGAAILAWRAKRLAERVRETTQRQEAEKSRHAEDVRAKVRDRVNNAMIHLGREGRGTWARVMLFVVTPDGRRLAQSASELAALSNEPVHEVTRTLEQLLAAGILRHPYDGSEAGPTQFEIADDAVAQGLLEWHSQYSLEHTRGKKKEMEQAAPASLAGPSAGRADFPYKLLYDMFRRNRVVPFIGAGVSMSARLSGDPLTPGAAVPANRELKELLARTCRFPPSEFEASDIAEVAAYFAQGLGRRALDDLLEETLHVRVGAPSTTHRLIADIARHTPLTMITTNYDTLMEQALDSAGVEYDVVSYLVGNRRLGYREHGQDKVAYVNARDVDEHGRDRALLFRMHGPAFENGRPTSSYVITEEDQIEWLLRADVSSGGVPLSVIERLSECTLVSLGHSARDWSQRALLHKLHQQLKRPYRKAFAVALNPAPLSVMVWLRYEVQVFNVELNEWASRMRSMMAAV